MTMNPADDELLADVRAAFAAHPKDMVAFIETIRAAVQRWKLRTFESDGRPH